MPHYTPEQRIAAFWNKTKTVGDCLIWTGHTVIVRGQKRGVVTVDSQHRYAHKFSLEMKLGRRVVKPMQANHTCDQTLCVRWAHLYEGTQAQNVADMHARGRAVKARGSAHGNAKLNEEKVRAIKIALAEGKSQSWLARQNKVSKQAISEIARGKNWPHVSV